MFYRGNWLIWGTARRKEIELGKLQCTRTLTLKNRTSGSRKCSTQLKVGATHTLSVALPGMGLVLGSGEVPLARLAERGRPGQGAGQVLRVWGCLKLGHVLPGPGLEALPWSTGDVCRADRVCSCRWDRVWGGTEKAERQSRCSGILCQSCLAFLPNQNPGLLSPPSA